MDRRLWRGGLVPGAWGGATQWEEDGDGTSLDFQVPHARFFASEFGEWLWTTEFAPQSELTVSIFGSGPPGTTLLWEGPATTDDEGFVMVDSSQHKLDLLPGYYIRVSDGSITKGLVLLPLRVLVFDTANNRMAGTAPAGSEVWVAAGLQESQDGITVIADTQGSWEADLTGIVDITEDMRAWSYAQIFDADGDVNEADPPWPEP